MTLNDAIDKNKENPLKKPKGVSQTQWNRALELYNAAKAKGDKYPELTVAQAALESGWFRRTSGNLNYFGQKASRGQKGRDVVTHEVSGGRSYKTTARFRDYTSLDEALDDRLDKWSSKYADASTVGEAIYKIWQYDPKTGRGRGYATDSRYDSKIKSILGMMGVPLDNKASKQNIAEATSSISKSTRYETVKAQDAISSGPLKRSDLLQFDRIQAIDEERKIRQQQLLESFQSSTELVQDREIVEFDEDPFAFDPYNYIKLEEFQAGGEFDKRMGFVQRAEERPEYIQPFDWESDLGGFEKLASKVLVGSKDMNEIEGIYNRLVNFKNKRGDSDKMSKEEIDLRQRVANANMGGYPYNPGDLKKSKDRVIAGEVGGFTGADYKGWFDKRPGLIRRALNNKYFELPYDDSLIVESNYSPSKSKDKNAKYFDFGEEERGKNLKALQTQFKDFDTLSELVGDRKHFSSLPASGGRTPAQFKSRGFSEEDYNNWRESSLNQLGTYTMSTGEDDKGRYISYYDEWDLDPAMFKDRGINIDKLNSPYEIYGRIYEDEFNKKAKK